MGMGKYVYTAFFPPLFLCIHSLIVNKHEIIYIFSPLIDFHLTGAFTSIFMFSYNFKTGENRSQYICIRIQSIIIWLIFRCFLIPCEICPFFSFIRDSSLNFSFLSKLCCGGFWLKWRLSVMNFHQANEKFFFLK